MLTGLKTCFYVGLVHLSMLAGQCFAVNAELNLAASTTLTLEGGASLDISGDVVNAGTMTLTNGNLTLTGNLNSSAGSFSQAAGTVTINDNAQTSVISGSNTFYNLTSATSNKTLQFQTGTTQTVNGTLTLTGGGIASTQTIKLRCSGCAGTRWNLSVAAGQSISYVDVQDSDITGSNDLTANDSVNSGNNDETAATPHWVFGPHASGTIGDTATSIADSGTDDVVRIRVTNLSNDASSVIRLDSVNIEFMDSAGAALSTSEAQNLFTSLKIYCDDVVDGVYGAGDTTVVSNVPSASISLSSGYQTFTVTDNACVRTGAPATYKDVFLVATLNSNATSQTKNAFKVYIKPSTPSSDMAMTNTYISSAVPGISGTATTSKVAKAAYWIFTLSNPIYSSPVIRSISGTNKVFFGSGDDVAETDGKLYRLDLTTGATDWSYPAGNTAGIRVIPSAFKDPVSLITYVYFGTENGKLYAVDETGTIRAGSWPVTVGGIGSALRSSPSLRGYITAWCATCIGVFIADGSANASIWAYDADDGDDGVGGPERWSSAGTGASILSQPFVNNNEVYIGAENGTIYKFLTADGSTLSSNTSCVGSARGGGYSLSSTLWMGCTNGSLYSLSTSGDFTTPNWSFPSGSSIESLIFNRLGYNYFGNNAGTLYKRKDDNTSNAWTYTAGGAIQSFPLRIVANDYFTANDGYLYSLTDVDGLIRLNFPASLGTGTVTVNPAVAIGGSRIVVSVTEGTTGKVFCFPDN